MGICSACTGLLLCIRPIFMEVFLLKNNTKKLLCILLAIAAAVGLYFWLNPILGMETASWVCVFGAAPFAVLGFVRYNGMSAEKFIWAWIKSELLIPKKLCYGNNNMYWVLMHEMKEEKKAGRKHRK